MEKSDFFAKLIVPPALCICAPTVQPFNLHLQQWVTLSTLDQILPQSHTVDNTVGDTIQYTLPPDLCETEQKPDLVVVMRNPEIKKVLLIELTSPWDCQSNFKAAFDRKTARYAQLALDLEDKGWNVSNLPIEIGTRGSVDKHNAANIETISNLCGIRAIQKLK